MFGRYRKKPAQERPLAVDATLERSLATVEEAIRSFLDDPIDGRRKGLVALEELDLQTHASVAFGENVIGSGAVGNSTKFSVIGETSANPIAEAVPATDFQAQIALVRAAKEAVVDRGHDKLLVLRDADASLAAVRTGTQAAP